MFIDSAIVTFLGGKGGDGCVSFRREKYVPKGGPNGGDGGDGGSIILTSSRKCSSLVDFKNHSTLKADKGVAGQGSNKTGRGGKAEHLTVPAGTVIKSFPEGKLIFDFDEDETSFTIVKGGEGGLGNARFKTANNRTPRFAQPGKPGETIKVIMELKLIAFAGLVGFPNAGKSTLISKISGAKPKIADYPFTTLFPNLGVVYQSYESLVVADIPGIIEGAHVGEGMGLDFLRHIERNKVHIFLLDASGFDEQSPLQALKVLRSELSSYKKGLLRKKSIVLANKMDLVEDQTDLENNPPQHLKELREFCSENQLTYMEISALEASNLNRFKHLLFEIYNGENQ